MSHDHYWMQASRSLAAEYSAKARPYADLWAPVLRPMAEPLLTALPLAGARTILDVGTGTGAFIPALRALAPGASIVGIDRAPGMLRVARSVGRARFAAMDAQCLALPPSAVDVATAIFMLFHLPDPLTGLRETRRVLRPGGQVGIVTWGRDPGTPGLSIWSEELDAAGAAPDPRDPRVMQQALMDSPDKLSALLENAGFAAPRVWSSIYRHAWTPDALFALHVGCGMPARRLPSLPRSVLWTCEQRVRLRLAQLSEAQRTYEPEILYAVATRPLGTA